MGWESKTKHASTLLIPATIADGADQHPDTGAAELSWLSNAKAGLATLPQVWQSAAADGSYEAYQKACMEVQLLMPTGSEASGGELPDLYAVHDQFAAVSEEGLNGFGGEALQQIAKLEGFVYPELASVSGGKPHPLAHWLNPAVDNEAESKHQVEALALARHDALQAGEEIGDQALSDLAVGSGSGPSWWASADELNETQKQLFVHAAYEAAGDNLADLIAVENRLATVACTDPGVDVPKIQAVARHVVNTALAGGIEAHTTGVLIGRAKADGAITDEQAKLLGPAEQVAFLRKNLPVAEHDQLAATLDARQQSYGEFVKAEQDVHAVVDANGSFFLPALSQPGAVAAAAEFALHGKGLSQACQSVSAWSEHVPGPNAAVGVAAQTLEQATTGFQPWAKSQPVSGLRDLAGKLGLNAAGSASRAQATGYVLAQWDSGYSTSSIQAAVLEGKAKPKPAGAPKSTPLPVPLPIAGGFAAQHADLVRALSHHVAAAGYVPARLPDGQVSGFSFGVGKPTNLGGAHPKTVHTGPDGNAWMFKPAEPSRAHAEAAASQVLERVGLPSVPVYTTEIDGKTGAVQPLISGASPLPSSPSSWSQAEVDAIVRHHVAAWMVGDHDGKCDNVLRTSSGGLVSIDHGQAFKFWGSDKLSLSFQPNASYGTTVHHLAYTAATHSGLAKGVRINPTAAHGVIKAFEQLPDAQWRAMLHTTATTGAQQNVPWVPAMRKKAAASLGIPDASVSNDQVAEAFLEHALERKHNLRTTFAAFFADELKLPGARLLEHA